MNVRTRVPSPNTQPAEPMKVAKRERKYRMLQVPFDQADARWKCETCDAPTENDESRWCIHCRMYWEDCRNGHD